MSPSALPAQHPQSTQTPILTPPRTSTQTPPCNPPTTTSTPPASRPAPRSSAIVMRGESISLARRAAATAKKRRQEARAELERQGVAKDGMDDLLAGLIGRSASTRANVSQNKGKRAKRVRWSPPEVRALRLGVAKYGQGRWAVILREFANDFHPCRISVDLKDKWRNLFKSQKTVIAAQAERLKGTEEAEEHLKEKDVNVEAEAPVEGGTVADAAALGEPICVEEDVAVEDISTQAEEVQRRDHVHVICEHGHEQPHSDDDDQYVAFVAAEHHDEHEQPHEHHHHHYHHQHHHHHDHDMTVSSEYATMAGARSIGQGAVFSEQVLHTDHDKNVHQGHDLPHIHHEHHHYTMHHPDDGKHPTVDAQDKDINDKDINDSNATHPQQNHSHQKQISPSHQHVEDEQTIERNSDVPRVREIDPNSVTQQQPGSNHLPVEDSGERIHHANSSTQQELEANEGYREYADRSSPSEDEHLHEHIHDHEHTHIHTHNHDHNLEHEQEHEHGQDLDHDHEHDGHRTEHVESVPQDFGRQCHCRDHISAGHNLDHVTHDGMDEATESAVHSAVDQVQVRSREHALASRGGRHHEHDEEGNIGEAVVRAITFENEEERKDGDITVEQRIGPPTVVAEEHIRVGDVANPEVTEVGEDDTDETIDLAGEDIATGKAETRDQELSHALIVQQANFSGGQQLESQRFQETPDATDNGQLRRDGERVNSKDARPGSVAEKTDGERIQTTLHTAAIATANSENGVGTGIIVETPREDASSFDNGNIIGPVDDGQKSGNNFNEDFDLRTATPLETQKEPDVVNGAAITDKPSAKELATTAREDYESGSNDDAPRMRGFEMTRTIRDSKRRSDAIEVGERDRSEQESGPSDQARKKSKHGHEPKTQPASNKWR